MYNMFILYNYTRLGGPFHCALACRNYGESVEVRGSTRVALALLKC